MNREEFIKMSQVRRIGKGKVVGCHASLEEYDKLKKAAKDLGISVSAYIRSRLFYED